MGAGRRLRLVWQKYVGILLTRECQRERIKGLENCHSNSLGEKRHVTDIPVAQPYNLAFPSMFYGSDVDTVYIFHQSHTPARSESACCSAPTTCKKAENMACAQGRTGKKGPFFTLQSIDRAIEIRIGEQWVESKEGGVQRLRTQTHGGESDCSTSPGSSRETLRRYLRKPRMLYINSCTTSIFRAAMVIKYVVYNKRFVILQYFIDEY